MNNLLKLEEFGMALLSFLVYTQLDLHWWIFFVLFLAPDIGMLGYLINSRIGAITYNLAHHKGIAVAFWITGSMTNVIPLQVTGIILFGHSSFDRVLGYGLKYSDSFHHTHLGMIGKNSGSNEIAN